MFGFDEIQIRLMRPNHKGSAMPLAALQSLSPSKCESRQGSQRAGTEASLAHMENILWHPRWSMSLKVSGFEQPNPPFPVKRVHPFSDWVNYALGLKILDETGASNKVCKRSVRIWTADWMHHEFFKPGLQRKSYLVHPTKQKKLNLRKYIFLICYECPRVFKRYLAHLHIHRFESHKSARGQVPKPLCTCLHWLLEM